jgi:hypothetical protein
VFDITIEVASTSGAQLVKTSARVRLKPGDSPAARRRLPSSIEELLRESKAKKLAPAAHAAVDTPFRTKVSGPSPAAAPIQADPPAAQAMAADAAPNVARTERKALPEGLSSLGGPLDRPEPENRQMWWKLPTPAWAPFGDVPSK